MSCSNLRGEEDLHSIINFLIKFLTRHKPYTTMSADTLVFPTLLLAMHVYSPESPAVSRLSSRTLKVVVGLWITITPGVEKISRPSFCHLKICGPADKSAVKEVQVREAPFPSCHSIGLGDNVGLGSSG